MDVPLDGNKVQHSVKSPKDLNEFKVWTQMCQFMFHSPHAPSQPFLNGYYLSG